MADPLEGELLSFSYRAEDGSFGVGKLRTKGRRDTTVVGPIGHVVMGQHVALMGKWTTHAQFGEQFKVERVLVQDPRTIRGLERYLGSGAVRGLGPTFAKRVVDSFGLDTLHIIEAEPEKLLTVEGIGKKRLEEIVGHYERDRRDREILATLRGYDIGQALANRIVDRFGKEAPALLAKQPYRLLEVRGIGFKTADSIALNNGISRQDPERIKAGLQYILDRSAQSDGHTYLPEDVLINKTSALTIPTQAVAEQIELQVTGGRLIRFSTHPGRGLALPTLARAEHVIASRLREMTKHRRSEEERIDQVSGRLNIDLNNDQKAAVTQALTEGTSVITGGPGTGKTTIVKVLTALARLRKEDWLLAAPTGRAAKRLSEATGTEARTIHRLLEYNPAKNDFSRDALNPLEADGVLIDEASMVDVPLMASLVEAIPKDCHLVLVGDADQLPSVGPGNVLRDVIRSGVVPVCALKEVYRQALDSGIVQGAHSINAGEAPVGGEQDKGIDDFFIVGRDEPLPAQKAIVEIVAQRLKKKGFDPLTDVQVLTPMHAGPLGTNALNEALQEALNPGAKEKTVGRKRFRVGDRVLQVRNNYDLDIFNGDVGRILSIDQSSMVVDFDGREVPITGGHLDDLELAYAISIHKSQGSEYPAVVVALHRQHRIMLRRNLIYTAVTRAKRFACIVGSPWAVGFAAHQTGGDERWTRLNELLAESDLA